MITTLVLAVFAFLFGLLHLWPDDRLDPRIVHIRAAAEFDRSPPEMAYRLHGFTAPAGEDSVIFGKFATDVYSTLGRVPDNSTPLQFTIDSRCWLSRGGCTADDFFSHLERVPKLLAANEELLGRYKALQSAAMFSTVLRPAPHSRVLGPRDLLLAQYLVMKHIVYLADSGNYGKAWALLESETTFHRKLLASADMIVMKMAALLLVEEDIRLRVLILSRGFGPAESPFPSRLTLPERSAVTAIRTEVMIDLYGLFETSRKNELAELTFETPAQKGLFRVLPYRRNATANLLVLGILNMAEASLLDTSELLEALDAWNPPRPTMLQRLNNGAGLMLVNRWMPNLEPYILRIHDLDRKILLANVAERMLNENVTEGSAAGWLSSLSREYRDPFTGEFPGWQNDQLGYPKLSFDDDDLRSRPTIDLLLP
jgi:hypothetical protein